MSELLLMTPGPTRVPERVLTAGARPMIHHRTPEFSKELVEALRLLQPLFGTREPVLPVHTTGRGAMEAAICDQLTRAGEVQRTGQVRRRAAQDHQGVAVVLR